jgi:hypothetical protein
MKRIKDYPSSSKKSSRKNVSSSVLKKPVFDTTNPYHFTEIRKEHSKEK